MEDTVVITNRVQAALYEEIPSSTDKVGPLVDPKTCEITNRCGLSIDMLDKYKTHMEFIHERIIEREPLVSKFLRNFSFVWNFYEVTITVTACGVYVAATYYEDDYTGLFAMIDLVIATIFLIDWILHFIGAPKKWEFVFSRMSFVDYLTIFPVYIEFLGLSGGLADLSFVRALRIFRALRILRMYKALEANQEGEETGGKLKYSVDTSEISKQITIIGVTLFSVFFIGAGIFHTLEDLESESFNSSEPFNFLVAFYFMIVSSSTLGYGDIFPLKTTARMISVVVILLMLYIFGSQISKVYQLMDNFSKYNTQYQLSNHIVVTGNFQPTSLFRFLSQFYHPDHGNVRTRCVIIGEEYPSSEIFNIMTMPRLDGKVKYLEGSPSSIMTMKKANADMAEAVFILTDQMAPNPQSQDNYAVLLSKMIHDQFALVKTYTQLVRPLNSLKSSSAFHFVVSTQDVKMGSLGTAIHNPGFSTLMGCLHTSAGGGLSPDLDAKWLEMFMQGLSQEFYCVKISKALVGMKFSDAVCLIYTNFDGILTLGVRTYSTSYKEAILVNPANYILKKNDYVYVITDDQASADLITHCKDLNEVHDHENPSHNAILALKQAFEATRVKAKNHLCATKDNREVNLVLEDMNGYLKNHIIVFGSMEGFEILVKVVREYSDQPICLVGESSPEDSFWNIAKIYKKILFLKGTVSNFQELYQTGIKDCFCALLLSTYNKSDPDVVLLARVIEMSFPGVRIICELVNETYIRFLGNKPIGKYNKISHYFWPRHISGQVYFASNLESLISQSYYNPSINDVILKLIGISKSPPELHDFNENSIVRTIKIPDYYFSNPQEKCLYSTVFKDLVHLNPPIIGLAVYSLKNTANANTSEEEREGMEVIDFPVICANPSPDTELMRGDRLVCIGGVDSLTRYDTISPRNSITPESISNFGISSIMLRNKHDKFIEEPPDFEDMLDMEKCMNLMKILGNRMQSSGKFKKIIETKTKMVDELKKETEKLKIEYFEKHQSMG